MDLDEDEDDDAPPSPAVASKEEDGMSEALGSFYASLGMDEGGSSSSAGNTRNNSPAPPQQPQQLQQVVAAPDEGSSSPGQSLPDEDRDRKKKKVGQKTLLRKVVMIVRVSLTVWFFSIPGENNFGLVPQEERGGQPGRQVAEHPARGQEGVGQVMDRSVMLTILFRHVSVAFLR